VTYELYIEEEVKISRSHLYLPGGTGTRTRRERAGKEMERKNRSR
jgi:hypothetical protein